MAVMASTGRGTKAVYHKKGADPGSCQAVYCTAAHYTPHSHSAPPVQRPPAHWPGAQPHLKENATRQVVRDGPQCAAVVALTQGRLDGSTERSTEGSGRAQAVAERVHWESLPPSDRTAQGRRIWRARVQRPSLSLALTHPVPDLTTVNPTDHTFG
jgi:hypothetical protein